MRMAGVLGKFRNNFDLTRAKVRAGALLGILGFPAYYLIWHDIYPQTYENAALRALCVGVLVIWLVADRFCSDLSAFFQTLTYAALVICLPFFFGFMFLANDGSAVWLGSLICGMLYLAVAVEIANFFCMFLMGSAVAVLVFFGVGDTVPDYYALAESLPVVLFALGGGLVLKFAEEWTIQANQRKAVALAGSIAHELRTPLLGIRLELENFSGLSDAKNSDEIAETLAHCNLSSRRLSRHVQKASHIVDCLLLNVREENFDRSGFSHHSMRRVLVDVMSRYPMSESERGLIKVRADEDFTFWGDDLLMAHVLMNLLKNAFSAVAAAEKGDVEIYLTQEQGRNAMCVRDTGKGLRADARSKIFERFYSETSGGAGLGLAFCRRVVDSFGGAVECYSEAGKFTEFRVLLPAGEG